MKQASKAAPSAALAKTTSTAVGAVHDYGVDAGQGFEHQTRADIAIPFLNVLQPLSPEITNNEAARAGMLFNSVTEQLTDGKTGLVFIPATTRHVFVEWVPREKGGGFVGIHEIESEVVKNARAASKEFGKYTTPAGNQLQETFYVYGVLLDDEGAPGEMAILAFTSTKITPYKRWNTKINMFTVKTPSGAKVRPPLFAHQVRITTTKEKNNKGEFFNVDLQPAVNNSVAESLLPPGHPALEAAKDLRKLVDDGVAKADYTSQRPEAEAAPGAPAPGAPAETAWNE